MAEDETVFVGTETGLYRSTNGGRAWRVTGFPTDCAPVFCLAFLHEDATGTTKILAGTENHGLLVSDAQGNDWTRLAEESIPESVNDIQVIRQSNSSQHLFALVDDGIMTSTDAGHSWARLMQTDGTPTAILVPAPAEKTIFIGLLGKGIVRLSYS